MDDAIELLPEGGVTTPRGFLAGALHVGVRSDWTKLDVALLHSQALCKAAAVYTSNRLKAAPLLITEKHLSQGHARAVVANSGCANAATGRRGLDDAIEMARLAGDRLGIDPHEVVVASTGVIGTFLPLDRIARGLREIELSAAGGGGFAQAIMTTDTVPKSVAARCGAWSIGGAAKGVGMIHPNLATMLCFLTTDAPLAHEFLGAALRQAVDASFNMIDVDSDTSTNDMVVLMANGLAGGDPIEGGQPRADSFTAALTAVCAHLAKAMVADGEGSTKVIEARVEGAASTEDARRAAREIVRSLGVKTMVYGQDANWGRVLAAVGNSGCGMRPEAAALYFGCPDGGEVCLYRDGAPQPYDLAQAKACLAPKEVRFRVELGLGSASAVAWGSDLTEQYVRLNSLYTT